MFFAFQVITDLEKPDGIYSFTFAVDEFSGIFPHPSFKTWIKNRLCFMKFKMLTKL